MKLAGVLKSLRHRERVPKAPHMVIAMALVGAIAGLLYGILSGQMYRTSAVVSVDPDVVSVSVGTTDPAAQAVFIGNFINSVTSQGAVAAASRESGIDEAAILDHVSASQLGSTNAVEISYQGDDPQKDGAIVKAIGEFALSAYTSSGFDRLERQVQLYRDNYNAKQDAVANFVALNSETDPGEHYNQVQLELIRTGNTDVGLKQELTRLQPLVVGYNNLVDERVRAGNLLQGALDRQFQLQSSADFPAASISMTTASKVSALATVLRYAILFGAAGLILGLALLATRWAFLRSRANRGNAGEAAEGAIEADADDVPVESEESADDDLADDDLTVENTAATEEHVLVGSGPLTNGRDPKRINGFG